MRGRRLAVAALLPGGVVLAADDRTRAVEFSKDQTGRLPAGWKANKTGQGEGSVWQVVADDTARSGTGYVPAQTAESPNACFNLCVLQDGKYRDLDLSVKFKAVRGE
jgi:hypothetical protein